MVGVDDKEKRLPKEKVAMLMLITAVFTTITPIMYVNKYVNPCRRNINMYAERPFLKTRTPFASPYR